MGNHHILLFISKRVFHTFCILGKVTSIYNIWSRLTSFKHSKTFKIPFPSITWKAHSNSSLQIAAKITANNILIYKRVVTVHANGTLIVCKLIFVEDIIRRFCTEKSLHTHYNDLKFVTLCSNKKSLPVLHCKQKTLTNKTTLGLDMTKEVFDLPNKKLKQKNEN